MIEVHPFEMFIPENPQHFLLGSFTGKPVEGYDWYYSNKRNQFWPIIEEVYGLTLNTKSQKQELFEKLKMAVSDIILSCERKKDNNSDANLTSITFNIKAIKSVLDNHNIKNIFFTSRFTEKLFNRQFKTDAYSKTSLITLPSPSPRYALMTMSEKVDSYRELLPKIP